MQARFYIDTDADQWDTFCAGSYASTFLHSRRFLSYHGDRFVDRSVVVTDDGAWLGVMPVAQHPAQRALAVSHPGITYGGMVHQGRLRGGAMLEALSAACALLRQVGFATLQYKALPHIYHQAPAQDDLYALSRLGARRYRCDLSCCVDLGHRLSVSSRRARGLRKAVKSGMTFETGQRSVHELWGILEENLARKHGARPTHTVEEIALLASRFPREIAFQVARFEGAVVAGVALFRCGPTVHAQYIASSALGAELSALDFVFEQSIDQARAGGARFFDFGVSTEKQGSELNEGLYRFKSEFGGSGIVHDFFELDMVGAEDANREVQADRTA
jgi:Acetyltransferase (GNAT) domain